MRQIINGLILLSLILSASRLNAQTTADPALLAEIAKIKAIDNHAHPLRYVGEGEKADDEYDALPLDTIEQFQSPVRLNPTNPEFIAAWHTLYGYRYNDMNEAHLRELDSLKLSVMRARGDAYPAWVLDQLSIETMLANRVAMGRGLIAPRFRWVAFDDALLFPLSNEAAKKSNPDYRGDRKSVV